MRSLVGIAAFAAFVAAQAPAFARRPSLNQRIQARMEFNRIVLTDPMAETVYRLEREKRGTAGAVKSATRWTSTTLALGLVSIGGLIFGQDGLTRAAFGMGLWPTSMAAIGARATLKDAGTRLRAAREATVSFLATNPDGPRVTAGQLRIFRNAGWNVPPPAEE